MSRRQIPPGTTGRSDNHRSWRARAAWLAVVLGAVLATGCQGPEPEDAGEHDGGRPSDGGSVDAGPVDAGPVDAGSTDAGDDAGRLDAGPPDAGRLDAGPLDAGGLDAGPRDAGSDSGLPDAGPADSGPQDAGGDGWTNDARTLIDAGPCGLGCSSGFECCSTGCVDVTADPQHCGACENACVSSQFCGIEPTCYALTFQNLCLLQQPIRVDDGESADTASGTVIGEALLGACPQMQPLLVFDQTNPVALEQSTGRPITGGDSMMVLAGGSYYQAAVAYLEAVAELPIISQTTVTTERLKRRNGTTIVDIPKTAVTTSHDFFVIQLGSESQSGTVVLSAYGLFTPGTRAAAFWFANTLLPTLATTSEQAFIYEWTDDTGDLLPNDGDTFTLVYSE